MNNELKHLFSVNSVLSVAFNKRESGSALVLAIVLTSMLAIIASLFLMTSRIQRMATASIAEDKDLDSAIDTVVAQISQQLVLDVPGIRAGEEYYDYPDPANPWLANLEPNEVLPVGSNNYCWRQISDVTGFLVLNGFPVNNVPAVIVTDTASIVPTNLGNQLADADGDGVSDSKWIRLVNMTSGKGQPVYAAVRVIDNGAMLNVNTAYLFDPNSQQRNRVDGSSQTQINLKQLARGTDAINVIDQARNPASLSLSDYQNDVISQIEDPCSAYTPFDISDELILRNRYMVDHNDTITRLKAVWPSTFDRGGAYSKSVPYDQDASLIPWFDKVSADGVSKWYYPPHIATTYNMDRIISPFGYRMANVNFSTTDYLYDMVRFGLYDGNPSANRADINNVAAQLAVNIKDYGDGDSDVNAFTPNGTNYFYGFERPCIYISEIVHAYQSADANVADDPNHNSFAIELHKPYYEDMAPGLLDEWHLTIDKEGNGFDVGDIDVLINWSGTPRFHVIKWEDPNVPLLKANWNEPNQPNPLDGAMGVGTELVLHWMDKADVNSYDVYFGSDCDAVLNADNGSPEFRGNTDSNSYDTNNLPTGLSFQTTYCWRIDDVNGSGTFANQVWSFTTTIGGYEPPVEQEPTGWIGESVFGPNSVIKLRRPAENGDEIVVDSVVKVLPGLVVPTKGTRSMRRDINQHKCIQKLWSNVMLDSTLGHSNLYTGPNAKLIQAHPANEFINVGEVGMVFYKNAYDANFVQEEDVRVDMNKPAFQYLFNYLTRFDPTADGGIDNDGDGITDENIIIQTPEWKIPGRININTAPWYVIAQLPWVSQKDPLLPFDPNLAKAIVGYRDRLDFSPTGPDYRTVPGLAGFRSIGELNNIIDVVDSTWSMDYYLDGGTDQDTFPDLSPKDGAPDDFEERDLIFARISDLVTVRSDVFTAYILIRLGTDGPQKRAIAILDRSDVYPDGVGGTIGRVKIRALHLVPDPR